MKRTMILLFAAVWLAAPAVKAADSVTVYRYRFTLEECLAYALGNSYTRQSMKLSEQARQDAWSQSRQERLPGVSASVGENFSNTKDNSTWSGTYGLSAGMTLWQGGAITNTIEQNRLMAEQSPWLTAQYENELTVQILQAFLNALGNEELLKYQLVMVKASEEQVRQGESQIKAGSILESDYLLLKAQYATDLNNITDTRIARENSLLTLKKLLSMDPMEGLEIVYPEASLEGMSAMPSMEQVIRRTVETVPDLRISDYDVDIAKKSVELAKSGYSPSLDLSGSIGTGHTPDWRGYGTQLSDGFNQRVGLTLSVPIYNNGRTRSKVTQSRIALEQAELQRKQDELNVRQTVAVEYQDVVSSYNKYLTNDQRQQAYQHTFEAYRAQFEAGAITAVDLLQQQNNYIGALNDYIQSKYGFMLKRKVLDVYMGVPVTM